MVCIKKILAYTLAASGSLGCCSSTNKTYGILPPDAVTEHADPPHEPATNNYRHNSTTSKQHMPVSLKAEREAWIKQETRELFGKRLSEVEYTRRNWLWVRCRSHSALSFDMGGTWFGKDGEDLREHMEKYVCPVTNWQFKYVGHQGWGDAMVSFESSGPWCYLDRVVEGMIEFTQYARDRYKREFYVWDCPGLESYEFWGTERAGKSWPGTGDAYDEGTKTDSKDTGLNLDVWNSDPADPDEMYDTFVDDPMGH